MKQNNKGFSVVEIVIVVFIMSILITIGIRNMGVLNTYDCRQCRTNLESAITNCKIDCLSKSKTNTSDVTNADIYLKISYEDKSVYVTTHVKGTDVKKEKISNRGLTKIGYRENKGTEVFLNDGESIKIGFNRSTGAFLPVRIGASTGQKDYITHLVVTCGKAKREIKLETKTGKMIVE